MKVSASIIVYIACLLLCISSSGAQEILAREKFRKEELIEELIKDGQFTGGFKLTPLHPEIVRQNGGFDKTYVDTLGFGAAKDKPVWQMAQWHSAYSLAKARRYRGAAGTIRYKGENASKTIALYPDHSLLLELNASKDYDHPRVKGEQWPHLLIQQDFGEDTPNVGKATSLLFSMQVKLEKCENRMSREDFNPALHTAHTPFFFVLRNANKASEDFGEKIWFGIPSYDYRHERLRNEEKVSWDIGTSTYIYNVPPRRIWGDVSFHDKKWHKTAIDIKPFLVRALETMKTKGIFKHTKLTDLVLTGMNFGWEIPGTFDAAVRVKGISLVATYERNE